MGAGASKEGLRRAPAARARHTEQLVVHGAPPRRSGGHAWLAVNDRPWGRSAAIYDIAILDGWSGKGLGRQLLEAVERAAIEQGAGRIGLNVFGFNTVARWLYESAGFEIGGMGMVKLLPSGADPESGNAQE